MEELAKSDISGTEYPKSELISGYSVRQPILELIRKKYPSFKRDSYISVQEFNLFRDDYVRKMMKDEVGEISALENEVLESMNKSELLSKNPEPEIEERLSFGERLADKIADFGGSWPFIIIFTVFIILWMSVNVYFLASKSFDPYPFILLNLILSCIAAFQAPVIMMSQNRQETKDRQRSEYDYQVNLKAELEIRQLHEKLDHLMIRQSQRFMEIQKVQLEFLEQIAKNTEKS